MNESVNPTRSPKAELKKRRPRYKSCDTCRQRKIRCDGPSMPEKHCSNCLAFGEPCTYQQPLLKRGPKIRLVEELREENTALKVQLRSLALRPRVCSLCSHSLQPPEANAPLNFPTESKAVEISGTQRDQTEASAAEEDAVVELTDRLQQWKISSSFLQFKPRFVGMASNMHLVNTALTAKEKYFGSRPITTRYVRRPIYWERLPWEKDFYEHHQPSYVYPDQDLLECLMELYFTNVHPTFPVLHRHSFQRHVAKGLHLTNANFGVLLLAVSALAARYSDDRRVLIDGNPLSSGWTFVAQIQNIRNLLDPNIHSVQFYCLMTLFSLGTSTSHLSWAYLGLAIRFLRFHGAYLRKRNGHSVEDELWNRAFWSIFILDILVSAVIGRPPSMHIEDFDVDPPLEVDDIYWENGFIQPPAKPSELSFFVHFVRLYKILGEAMRRLYASESSKTRMGWKGPQWDVRAVSELDSQMNGFLDSVPPHLRWDHQQQGVFFDQAAVLNVTHYRLQIAIHRLYMHNGTPLAEPSLFICLRAARSALTVADVWMQRFQCMASPFLQNASFTSAVVLLLNIYALKRASADVSSEANRDLAHVRTAMNVLKVSEDRWQPAGRLWDVLHELQSLEGYIEQGSPRRAQNSAGEPELNQELSTPNLSVASSETDLSVPDHQSIPPGTSIEQLLAETTPSANESWNQSLNTIDKELMFMWLNSTDLMNVDRWDVFTENMTVTDGTDWSNAL